MFALSDFLGGQTKCFSHDEMPTPKKVDALALVMVDYATALCIQLCVTKEVIIHCTNSRSRSPNVVAAFLLLFRTIDLEHILIWYII